MRHQRRASALLLTIGLLCTPWAAGWLNSRAAEEPPTNRGSAPNTAPTSQPPAELSTKGTQFLERYCAKCHADSLAIPVLDVRQRDRMLETPAGGTIPFVTPGNIEKSLIWQVVGERREMPPESGAGDVPVPQPTDAELATLKEWVLQGAPFPQIEERPIVGRERVMQLIHEDLQQATPANRVHYRYVVNDTLHNSRHVSRTALQQSHIAFSKLLNSVSWSPELVHPLPLDDEQIVFRVDLRQLRKSNETSWNAEDWLGLTSDYPYGLALSFTDGPLGKRAAEVYDWLGTRIPAVRLDWFVQTVSRPKLYHQLLGLPATRQQLEQMLGVQSERITGDNVVHMRGGVRKSPVGDSGRVLARFETRFGYYWISYDFLRDTRVTDFIVRPLGPVADDHPYLEHAFVEAGGEIIFSLPNGLQAYYVCDRIGNRLDVAPTAIVQDRVLQASGGAEVFNGISCIACHEKGMQHFRDIVRQTSRLPDQAANELVQQMYRPQTELDEVLNRDSQQFLRADAAVRAAFRPPNGAVVLSKDEPILATARLYRRPLALQDVARELGDISSEALESRLNRDVDLRRLGLGILLSDGAIPREEWEFRDPREDAHSLYQRVARHLQQGVPATSVGISVP